MIVRSTTIFVGGGALLFQAVATAKQLGLDISLVCCPVGDSALPRLRRLDVAIIESDDPNADLPPYINKTDTIFSINNSKIIGDTILEAGRGVFNIHNGLVQKYRGLSEVCVMAALCHDEVDYGVTLHRILPGQKVDTGPVIAQSVFRIADDKPTFFSVMKRSLDLCRTIFEENVLSIVNETSKADYADLSGSAYSYRDVPILCKETNLKYLAHAVDLGAYRSFFPRLQGLIDQHASIRLSSSDI